MDITEQQVNDIMVLGLSGRLDALAVDQVQRTLLAHVHGQQPRLVIDCSQLTYVSSAGLRVLLAVAKKVAAAQGKLALCAMVRQVSQVFELAGFASLIPIFATREEALASLTV